MEELEQNRSEESSQLRAAHERLRFHIEKTPLAYIAFDVDFRITEWNAAAEKIFGYSQEEALGQPGLDLIVPPEVRPQVEIVFQELRRGEIASYSEGDNNITKDGRRITCDWFNTPLRNETGEVTGHACMAHDITERRRSEEQLRRQGVIVASSHDMLALLDKTVTYLTVNASYASAFGKTPDEMIGLSAKEMFGQEQFEKTIHPDAERCLAGEQVRYDTWIDFPVGGKRYMSITYVPDIDEDGAIRGFVVNGRDITERKRLEDQLIQSQKMEAIGTLAGGIAHDMNNVLAVVLGLGTVLENEMAADDPTRGDIQEIVAAARRGRSLVENLLGFARKGRYRRETASVNVIAKSVVTVLERTIAKKIVVNTQFESELDDVDCDPNQISQVVMNLCVNAIDAVNGKGTIAISTSNEELDSSEAAERPGLEAGRYVELCVRDDGSGMDEETRERAFEPFFTTKGVGRGTGLGLPMVYGTIENHGGAVWIDSSPGQGTAVHVLLPVTASERAESAKSTAEVRGGKGRILLIDDEEMIRITGRRMLESVGFEVAVADSGTAALELFRDRHAQVDLVILDLSMPVMDGVECFFKLKAIAADVRVLICTGHGSHPGSRTILDHGAVGMVNKPFELQQIADAVSEAIGAG